MKSPMNQRPDHLAREATEEFIAENSRTADGRQEGGEGGQGGRGEPGSTDGH